MLPRVLLLDNHDSFTWNLAQVLEESGLCRFEVYYPEDVSDDLLSGFDKILISPGPGIPAEFPSVKRIIQDVAEKKSILGICFGHQAIVEIFGGKLNNLPAVVHGIRKDILLTAPIDALFYGMPLQFKAGLYHSWAADKVTLPSCLRVTAISSDGIIMGIAHEKLDVRGVQFHPESFMTEYGSILISNWLRIKPMHSSIE